MTQAANVLSAMTPGQWFLLVMGLQYLAAGVLFAQQANWGYSITMLAYGIANGGLMWAAK